MGIPLPVIYLFEDENGRSQVVDGRQRLETVLDFMNDKLTLKGLKLLPQFNGKKYSALDPLYRGKLERFQIMFYVIEPPTPERVKYDIFDMVNRGGTGLNSQEMRNALYCGSSTELLKKMSMSHEFLAATGDGVKSKRLRDQYIILRFFAFYLVMVGILKFEYKSNIEDLLATTMKYLNESSSSRIEELENLFLLAMERSCSVLGKDGFRFYPKDQKRRPVNMLLFEVMAYFFAVINDDILKSKGLKENLNGLKEEFDSQGSLKNNVDSSKSLMYRFDRVNDFIGECRDVKKS